MSLKPAIPIDRLLLESSAAGARAANRLIAVDRPDVNFIAQSLHYTVPPLAKMMRDLVSAQGSHGYDHIAKTMDEELASAVNNCMYCELLHEFLEGAMDRQANRERHEKLIEGEKDPAKKAKLQQLMHIQVSDGQAAIVQAVKRTVQVLANNRSVFMDHYQCFTVSVSVPPP